MWTKEILRASPQAPGQATQPLETSVSLSTMWKSEVSDARINSVNASSPSSPGFYESWS